MARIFDVATLADHWGCGTDTVYALIKGGELAAFKVGGKLIRIRSDEVERYECRMNTPSQSTGESSPSSGGRMADATDIRLERLTVRPLRQQPGEYGGAAR